MSGVGSSLNNSNQPIVQCIFVSTTICHHLQRSPFAGLQEDYSRRFVSKLVKLSFYCIRVLATDYVMYCHFFHGINHFTELQTTIHVKCHLMAPHKASHSNLISFPFQKVYNISHFYLPSLVECSQNQTCYSDLLF